MVRLDFLWFILDRLGFFMTSQRNRTLGIKKEGKNSLLFWTGVGTLSGPKLRLCFRFFSLSLPRPYHLTPRTFTESSSCIVRWQSKALHTHCPVWKWLMHKKHVELFVWLVSPLHHILLYFFFFNQRKQNKTIPAYLLKKIENIQLQHAVNILGHASHFRCMVCLAT